MPRSKVEKPKTLKALLANSEELQAVARQLAAMALARVEQDGQLGVRQREKLRRAVAAAGDALGWAGMAASSDDSVAGVSADVLTLAKAGAKAMAQDLADELKRKKVEVAGIQKAADTARKIGESPKTEYPVELSYVFTARDPTQVLVTKTENLVFEEAKNALSASESIEKGLSGRTKLTDQMIVEIKAKQGRVDVMTRTLPDFLKYSQGLIREVLATLQ